MRSVTVVSKPTAGLWAAVLIGLVVGTAPIPAAAQKAKPAAAPAKPAATSRLEHDLLGEKSVPANAYYGVQTARALENFQISGVPISLYPNFIKALAMVKARSTASTLRA